MPRRARGDDGVAALLELVGLLPLLALSIAFALQLAVAGVAALSAEHAARNASRAIGTNRPAWPAATQAVPSWLAEDLEVDRRGREVVVRVRVPVLLPGVDDVMVAGDAELPGAP